MGKCSRVAGVLAVGNALLLVVGLGLPSRVNAQTPAQGQTLAILFLIGLGGPRSAAHQQAIQGGQKPISPSDARQAIQGQKPTPPSDARQKPIPPSDARQATQGQKPTPPSDARQATPGHKPAPASVAAGTDPRARDKVAKKPQGPEGRLVRVTYDEVNGRKVVRTVEFGESPAEGKMSAALPLATPASGDARVTINGSRHSLVERSSASPGRPATPPTKP